MFGNLDATETDDIRVAPRQAVLSDLAATLLDTAGTAD